MVRPVNMFIRIVLHARKKCARFAVSFVSQLLIIYLVTVVFVRPAVKSVTILWKVYAPVAGLHAPSRKVPSDSMGIPITGILPK